MFPTFPLGLWRVPTHGFFVALGVCLATAIFFWEARRRHMLDERLLLIAFGTLVCGAVAAKASTLWLYVSTDPNPSLVGALLNGGKSILGGLAGAYFGAILTKRVVGYRERTGDLFAPAVAAGMAVGRWGCFLTEQIGTPTTLPWGIRVSDAVAAHVPNCPYCSNGTKMHPSFLYEIVFHLVAFAGIWWLRPRLHVKGELLKVYLLAYALFRFAVEFVRGNPVLAWGLSRSQWFLLPSSLLLALHFWRQWRKRAYRVPAFVMTESRSS